MVVDDLIPTDLERRFRDALPVGLDYVSLRVLAERNESLALRRGVLQPLSESVDCGAMVTVHHQGGLGYAATPDLSTEGLRQAITQACRWADRSRGRMAFDVSALAMPDSVGEYRSPVQQPLAARSLADRIELLSRLGREIPGSERIVDWELSLSLLSSQQRLLTNHGGHVSTRLEILSPDATIVAHAAGRTQRRSLGLRGISRQGGWELLGETGFEAMPARLGEEALALLDAPDCPAGTMDLLLAPDQMMLQIHESIGHPLELDRILGDERNYAGTSFVTPDMFGSYRYGSELLNVTYDPTVSGELASFGWDDEGRPARRELLIDKGILMRGLGGTASEARSGLPGVANARSSGWNRPPIDRMANLNVEPGDQSFDELVSSVERGVYMETNTSWSIDDSRNKFQFGCEIGWVIEDGERKHMVRNPNYRGVSATFWRSLAGVGAASTRDILGTPYCGKGEPNQVIRVGHASPPCLFRGVDVFGGA